MYYGTRLQMDYRTVWLEGMKDWHGKLPERMTNDQMEEKFWQDYLAKREGKLPQPDPYAIGLMKELHTLFRPTDSVLEIGPGWGNYTFETARIVSDYTCLDSSSSVLRYLRETAEALSIQNMRWIHSKWEEHAPDSGSYDIVFGINCYYRMQEIVQAMLNMNRAARRLAIIGLTSGPEPPHYWEIHRKLGIAVKFSRRDYIHLTNLLYQLGIDVNCRIIPLERVYAYDTWEQLVEVQTRKLIMNEERPLTAADQQAIQDIVRKYAVEVEGRPAIRHRFKAALLYWQPVDERHLVLD
ncbi:class I SAM-dependent methyltransferase [Paenibacillus senegalensis]|uniref:class I SAM-dependent methyltransferase n=1 Tax=Paenibacillus senegalensis TaxID=1465766 RepID=UPI000287ACC5|nr:class I SAM-dependent methyltransferase [Paenibacillus senegalensis]